jgi:hypothetical protein
MLDGGASRRHRKPTTVEPQQAIRTGVTASAIAHLSILALVILFSEVHPFGSVIAEPIAVDLVAPEEVTPSKPEPPAEMKPPSADPSVFTQKAPEKPPAAAPQAAAQPQQMAALPAPLPARRETSAQPPATLGSSSPGYKPPEPDLSIKYNVMLGLPPELPPPASSSGQKADDGYDATAVAMTADVASSVVVEFRRHLKTCSKLPASVEPSDHIMVRLRVFMTPEGKLAGDPAIGGGSATIKAIDLMQSAINALKACQPYTMLPADRYGEWKALDLIFTPKDFAS